MTSNEFEYTNEHRIVCAAIRFNEACGGHIVIGARHYDEWMRKHIHQIYGDNVPAGDVGEQGFIDNRNQFWGREAAFVIAKAAGQIRKKSGNLNSQQLFSEDLY